MSEFNFKKYLTKQACYDGAQGLALGQSRGMANCIRAHLTKGMTGQKAQLSCIEEYQTSANKIEWISKYVTDEAISKGASAETDIVKTASETPAKPAPPVIKLSSHLAGLNISEMSDSQAILYMAKNGYSHTYKPGKGGGSILVFKDSAGELARNPSTGVLEKV